MVTGPFFFPVGYQKYYFVTIAYLTVRSIMTFLWTVVGSYKAYCLLNKYEEKGKFTQVQLEESKNERKERLLKKQQEETSQEKDDKLFYHAFIIPSYNQD